MRTTSILAALAPLLLLACSSAEIQEPNDDPQNDTPPAGIEVTKSGLERDTAPVVSDAAKKQVVADNTDFALALFKKSAKPGANLVQSPHSIATALGMAYAGAAGQTKADMATALHFGLPDAELHAAFDWLDLEIEAREQGATGKDGKPARVHVDNLLFGANDATFGAPFLDTLAVSYGAGVQRVDFTKPSTTGTINAWVAERTENRIPQLLGDLDPETRLVLVNTVYINSAWTTKFEKSATKNGAFHAAGGDLDVAFMHGLQSGLYADTEAAKVVELGLSTEGLVFDVIVPKTDLATFEAAQTHETLDALWASLQFGEIDLSLPKFKLEPQQDGSIKQQLSDLGMASAFGAGANFEPMVPNEGLQLFDVVHKTFFEIDEDGLEAAAATAVIAGDSALPQIVPIDVDQPFVVVLRDQKTGQVLFLGHIADPTAK